VITRPGRGSGCLDRGVRAPEAPCLSPRRGSCRVQPPAPGPSSVPCRGSSRGVPPTGGVGGPRRRTGRPRLRPLAGASNRQTTVHRTESLHPGPQAAGVASLAAGDVSPIQRMTDGRPSAQDDAMVRRCGSATDVRRQGRRANGICQPAPAQSRRLPPLRAAAPGPDNADPARHGYTRRQRRDEPQISPSGETKTGQSTAATHTGSCPAESAGVISSATVQT
jgi:hypothetical protein